MSKSNMYAVNQHDTGHIGIHGGVDVRTVDDVMATKISRIDGLPWVLTI